MQEKWLSLVIYLQFVLFNESAVLVDVFVIFGDRGGDQYNQHKKFNTVKMRTTSYSSHFCLHKILEASK